MCIPCSICKGSTILHGKALFRSRHEGSLLRCENCGFIFVDHPYWLEEAYAAPINISDTGYVARNIHYSAKTRYFIEMHLNPDRSFLDYAAGYGLFVRLMRDLGYDFRWYDLYCQNLFARGFEEPRPLSSSFEAITAFEVFEHLVDPQAEMKIISPLTSCLIFSTTLLPTPAPAPGSWWYYGLDHGQHIAFYTLKSLELLAQQFGYTCISDSEGFHVFYRPPVSIASLTRLNRRWNQQWIKRTRRRRSLVDTDYQQIVRNQRAD